jgi:hypothetical protein
MGIMNLRRVDVKDALAAVGLAVAITSQLIVPALSRWLTVESEAASDVAAALRFIFALVALFLGLGIFATYLRNHISGALSKFASNPVTGLLQMEGMPAVSLRVDTLHRMLDSIAAAVPEDRRDEVLYQAGYAAGQAWGKDFVAMCRRNDWDREPLDQQLSRWSDHDAIAGMGRFQFALDREGAGVVKLTYGFLSSSESTSNLDGLVAGYIAGTLSELLDRAVRVEPVAPSTRRRRESTFRVTGRPE